MTSAFDGNAVTEIASLAQSAKEPTEIGPGLYLGHDGKLIDLRAAIERGQDRPDRKTASPKVTDVPSLAAYLVKHGLPETELWASRTASNIEAVINAHRGVVDDDIDGDLALAGWGDHTVTLQLTKTRDWLAWAANDGKLLAQTDFAEFVEDNAPLFVDPTAADMLELAQTFKATTKVDFASSSRVKSGETQLAYAEHQDASAGRKGTLAIPDTFTIGLQPYEGGAIYRVTARFRYRIRDARLFLGYRLTRPDDVLRNAFDEVVGQVVAATGREVWQTP